MKSSFKSAAHDGEGPEDIEMNIMKAQCSKKERVNDKHGQVSDVSTASTFDMEEVGSLAAGVSKYNLYGIIFIGCLSVVVNKWLLAVAMRKIFTWLEASFAGGPGVFSMTTSPFWESIFLIRLSFYEVFGVLLFTTVIIAVTTSLLQALPVRVAGATARARRELVLRVSLDSMRLIQQGYDASMLLESISLLYEYEANTMYTRVSAKLTILLVTIIVFIVYWQGSMLVTAAGLAMVAALRLQRKVVNPYQCQRTSLMGKVHASILDALRSADVVTMHNMEDEECRSLDQEERQVSKLELIISRIMVVLGVPAILGLVVSLPLVLVLSWEIFQGTTQIEEAVDTMFALLAMFFMADEAHKSHSRLALTDQQAMGFVSQDSKLFARSIRENIWYGNEGSPDDDLIWEVLEQVGLATWVEGLRESLDTVLATERMVSGGQAQRLQIARLLCRKGVHYVLLDECMSALDPSMRAHVTIALQMFLRGKTALVITHSHDTISDLCDHVVHIGKLQAGEQQAFLSTSNYLAGIQREQAATRKASKKYSTRPRRSHYNDDDLGLDVSEAKSWRRTILVIVYLKTLSTVSLKWLVAVMLRKIFVWLEETFSGGSSLFGLPTSGFWNAIFLNTVDFYTLLGLSMGPMVMIALGTGIIRALPVRLAGVYARARRARLVEIALTTMALTEMNVDANYLLEQISLLNEYESHVQGPRLDSVVHIVVVTIFCFVLFWQATVFTVLLLAITILLRFSLQDRLLQEPYRRRAEITSNVHTSIDDVLRGADVVATHNMEWREMNALAAKEAPGIKIDRQIWRVLLIMGFPELFAVGLMLPGVLLLARLMFDDTDSVSDAINTLFALTAMYFVFDEGHKGLITLILTSSQAQSYKQSLGVVNEVLAAVPPRQRLRENFKMDGGHDSEMESDPVVPGSLVFENVTISKGAKSWTEDEDFEQRNEQFDTPERPRDDAALGLDVPGAVKWRRFIFCFDMIGTLATIALKWLVAVMLRKIFIWLEETFTGARGFLGLPTSKFWETIFLEDLPFYTVFSLTIFVGVLIALGTAILRALPVRLAGAYARARRARLVDLAINTRMLSEMEIDPSYLLEQISVLFEFEANVKYQRTSCVVRICFVIVFCLVLFWQGTLLNFAFLLAMVGLHFILQDRMQEKPSARRAELMSKVHACIIDVLRGADVVATHNMEKSEMKALAAKEEPGIGIDREMWQVLFLVGFPELIILSVMMPSLILLARLMLESTESVSDAANTLFALTAMFFVFDEGHKSLRTLIDTNSQAHEYAQALERVNAALTAASAQGDTPGMTDSEDDDEDDDDNYPVLHKA
ncbi:ABC transporter B family member 3 [Hondaea fermentalgiana]|uniref:ABC transporter B family member 3 n=1 Tax=Hondaea fermentalgiana TaxID=2315210 RepID=A0A2R5GP92_9STRA|nr:ABC transporter B family member 3 [Hondaea fermentalgiana]|eukprot:GBG32692.1 ABC transporter B family member 3 [Hondaea fermentalgiana]